MTKDVVATFCKVVSVVLCEAKASQLEVTINPQIYGQALRSFDEIN